MPPLDSQPPAPITATSSGVPVLMYSGRIRVLCVGGGPVAAGKVVGLMEGGAGIRVIAPDAVPELRAAAEAARIAWERRSYRRGDIGDAHLVIAGTSHAEVNATVAADADAAGRLCVRVDEAAGGTAAFMGAVRRGPVVFGVSTSGAAPGLARLLRRELEQRYGPEHGRLATLWGELRANDRVMQTLSVLDQKTRRTRWRALYRSDILDLIRAGKLAEAKEAALACLLSSSD
jgi:precorrin-2 dehydrogenase / sirohydrochlorin ferrochelatase